MHRAEIDALVDPLALHRLQPDRYPFLLQSAAPHAHAGRYDFAFAFPGEALTLSAASRPGRRPTPDFFAQLAAAAAAEVCAPVPGLPFCGGWFLLLGYEAARAVEPRLRLPASPFAGHGLPDALAVRCTGAVIADRLRGRTLLVAEDGPAQLEALRLDCLATLHERRLAGPSPAPVEPMLTSVVEEPASRFIAGVEHVLDYLRAGDVFQVNLSRRWRAQLAEGARYADLYAALCRTNPAPFAGLAHWNDVAVLSSSPERLLSVQDGWAEARPIAGTHARLLDAEADTRQRAQLIGSLKERAEHLMLIDLERNDLGRVCRPGTIEVNELMAIESHAHVHHIVSNVRGRLRTECGAVEALQAVFPGGTITGCPKVRAMEIIAELEGEGRGPYTGAMGYLSRCGRLDTNILIRTLLCAGTGVSFRAGAGIVADSNPERELAETRAKALGLLMAGGARP